MYDLGELIIAFRLCLCQIIFPIGCILTHEYCLYAICSRLSWATVTTRLSAGLETHATTDSAYVLTMYAQYCICNVHTRWRGRCVEPPNPRRAAERTSICG